MLDKFQDELNTLTEQEKNVVFQILNEYSKKGTSEQLQSLLYEDYEEIPVDIDTFLDDPEYLGKGLVNEEGKKTVFPYWRKTLRKIFPDNLNVDYNTVALTGSIGIGKSFIAVICILYLLYRMLCLKDPYLHYGLQPIDKITFGFMNITLDASKGVAWDKCQQLLQISPWFMKHGTVSGTVNVEWKPPKGIELIAGSLPRHIIGRAVFAIFMDEVSFQPNSDVEEQKRKAKELVSTAAARMQSRFMKGEYNPTLLLLASSKRTEQSYMETFIENKRKTESKTTLVIDEPQWVIRTDKDSPNKFKVALGNKFLDSEVLPLNCTEKDVNDYINRGFQIIDVPMGYYENFIDDIDIALTDIAGISTSNVTRYISGSRLSAVKMLTIQNLMTKDIITVGNAPDDKVQYWEYMDMTRLDSKLKSRPMYIHLDMSISGDKTGIAGVWILGKKPHQEGVPDSNELYYRLAFSFAVKAPKGYQVSFEKNKQFIYWLREQGFNIKGVSTDTFQNAAFAQSISAAHFNYSIISVDRVDSNHICVPYQTLKNVIYEERIQMYDSKHLTEELLGLERNNNGRIDHSERGINCFTGDTQIQMLDGSSKTMLELLNDFNNNLDNYVYSFNHEKQIIEPKKILKVFKSGENARLVKVTLDNGETIRCTPEHRFMLRDGSYVEAANLIPMQSLMPLYTKYPKEGLTNYRLYYEPMENKWHYEHRRFAVEVYDEKYLVHHKDCNPRNNAPSNLIWMSKSAHIIEHSRLQTGAQSIEAKLKRANSVKLSHANVDNTKNGRLRYYHGSIEERLQQKKQHDDNLIKQNEFYTELSRLFNIDYLSADEETKRRCIAIYANYKSGRKVSFDLNKLTTKKLKEIEKENQLKACEYYNIDIKTIPRYKLHGLVIKYYYECIPGYKEHIAQQVSINHKKGVYKNAEEALSDRIWWTNGKLGKENNLYLKQNDVPPEGFRRGRTLKNHKVISVEFIEDTEDVYDIEVEDNHNFALASGVFVHNSKDEADAVCGAIYNASQHAEEFAFEFGEDIENMLTVSSNSEYKERKQIQIDLEEELKHTFNNSNIFMDFGQGKATTEYNPLYAMNGIII